MKKLVMLHSQIVHTVCKQEFPLFKVHCVLLLHVVLHTVAILLQCPNCLTVRNETLGLLEAGDVGVLPHVTAAFFQTLSQPIRISARRRAVLSNYHQVSTLSCSVNSYA